jgi:hypothetical protein
MVFPWFSSLYWDFPAAMTRRAQVMRATGDLLTPRAESFEVFGFDVMVDEAPITSCYAPFSDYTILYVYIFNISIYYILFVFK